MTRKPAQRFAPGIFILDELSARGWSREDFCRRADITPSALSAVVDRFEPLSEDMTRRIGRAFGTSAILWARMDAAFQAEFAELVAGLDEALRSGAGDERGEDATG